MSIREKVEKFIESGKANQAEIEAVTKTAHEALNKVYEVVQRTGIPIQLSTPYDGWFLPSNFLVGTRVVGNVTAGELRALMRERDEARAEVARLTADGAYVLLGDAAQAIADLRRERDEALAVSYPRVLRAAAHVVDRETRVVTDVVLNDIADAILALTPDDIDRLTKEHEHG